MITHSKHGKGWLNIVLTIVGIIVLGSSILAIIGHWHMGTRLPIGKDEIYYNGSSTAAEAQALGDALKKDGYFQDRAVTVQLHKGDDGAIISFTVKDGFWDDPSNVDAFQTIVCEVAPTVGGLPIKLRLLNDQNDIKKEVEVTKEYADVHEIPTTRLAVGEKGEIFYSGLATAADAQKLADELTKLKYSVDSAWTVHLHKNAGGTVVSFTVPDGAWDDQAHVDHFEAIAREVAPAIGGLPLKMRMTSKTDEVKKEIDVKATPFS